MEINEYNSMVNSIFHAVFFWTCSRAAGAAGDGGGAGMMVAAAGAAVAAAGGAAAGAWGKFSRDPRCFPSEWCQVVHFYFSETPAPWSPTRSTLFFFCYGRKCVRTKESSIKFAAFLRWLLTSRLHTHQPLEPPRLFFVPLSRTLGRTCERVITPSDAEATTFSTLPSVC